MAAFEKKARCDAGHVDLSTDLNGICDEARETRQPIFMTKNGSVSLVVIDCDVYEGRRQHDRYVMKRREAEIEARYRPEVVSPAQLDERWTRYSRCGS